MQPGREGNSETVEVAGAHVVSAVPEADDDRSCEGKYNQIFSIHLPLKPTSEAGYGRQSVASSQQGVGNFSNEAPLPYPIAECKALAEEENRFCNGMKKNAEELMDLSTLANRYLQQSQDEPPPIIDESSPPSEIQ